jgi:hypothetical protein
MIVNYTESGWQVITQRSHGLLAAQICAYWRKADQGRFWLDTLVATAEHDDVYNELENRDLINGQGGPVNFKMTEFEMDYGVRLVQMAETKSAWVALMVSRHIQFVHGKDPKAADFIAELKKREKFWMKVLSVAVNEVDVAYKLLEFCDAFSLLICQQAIQPEQRKMDISSGPDGLMYSVFARSDLALVVDPWPFDLKEFKLSYESRTVSQLCFKGVAEFRKVIFDTPAVLHELVVCKG